jgi:hypothetical protein
MNDFEAPERTEDALRLLDSARSYRQMEAEATSPAAAASFRDEAERREAAASGFLELAEKPAVGTGRELTIPREEMGDLWGLKETLDHPGRETIAASRARLELLVDTEAVDLGVDAAATIDARNSLEKMLAHQMAAAHRMSMRLMRRAEQELRRQDDPAAVQNAVRCTSASNRMMKSYQEGLLTLGRMRTGGQQVVTVQHVTVSDGGQAMVAGHVDGGQGGARRDGGDYDSER